jgi:pimeloyl-ACP methyl ester carboxylesterase
MASRTAWLRRGAIGLGMAAIGFLVVGWTFERIAEANDRTFRPPGRLVDIGGRRLHLNCTGTGTPTVILEPGAGEFSLLMGPLQRRISAFARVCSYDRAGFAWSDPAPPNRSFDQRAADLAGLLDRARIDPPYVLVGASYGGLLVRSFARQRPGSVGGMVLVDAAEEELVFRHLPLLESAARAQNYARMMAEFGIMRLVVAGLAAQARHEGRIPPDARQEDVDAAIAFSARPSAFGTGLDESTAYALVPANERVAGGFGRLGDKPLIVIRHGKAFAGLNAPLAALEAGWAASQLRLASLSTDSRVIVATANGHDIAMENPGLVAQAVRAVVVAVRTGTSVNAAN